MVSKTSSTSSPTAGLPEKLNLDVHTSLWAKALKVTKKVPNLESALAVETTEVTQEMVANSSAG